MLSFFPLDVLDEIWDVIESVSEGFLTYSCTPYSRDCKDSKYVYPAAGHVITGNLRIISDSQIRSIIANGPKYTSD